MAKPTTVYLLNGRTGAGKTTLAKWLARELPALRISHDQWLRTAFGPEIDQADFKTFCANINALIWQQVRSLAEVGVDVVLEGFGGRSLRDLARQEIERMGLQHQLIYIECPQETRWQRVQERNAELGEEGFRITREAFERMEKFDEQPGSDEPAIVLQNSGLTSALFQLARESGIFK